MAWIVDDTGFPKQGKHSVGVARQYCGQVGKQDNCQAAVSLSVSTWNSSLPIAWRLYLPEVWCQDAERCRQSGRSGRELRFKPSRRLRWSRFGRRCSSRFPWAWYWRMQAMGTTRSSARAHRTRAAIYSAALSPTPVWEPGKQPLPAPPRKPGREPPLRGCSATPDHQAGFGETVGSGSAVVGLEEHRLATRQSGNFAIPFCRGACASCPSR